MTFWEVFNFLFGLLLLLIVAYFGIMSAFMPKPKYIYDDEEDNETN